MYCPKCGNKLEDDWSCCPYCDVELGIAFNETNSNRERVIRPAHSQRSYDAECSESYRRRLDRKRQRKKRKLIISIIFIGIFLIVVGSIVTVCLDKRKENNEEEVLETNILTESEDGEKKTVLSEQDESSSEKIALKDENTESFIPEETTVEGLNFDIDYTAIDNPDGYVFPESSTINYSGDPLIIESNAWVYQYGINEIYAKHGYIFQNQEVKELFEFKNWYKQNDNFSENLFTSIEKHNIDFLVQCIERSGKEAGLGIPEEGYYVSSAEITYFCDEIDGVFYCEKTGVHITFYHEMGSTYAFVEIPDIISKTIEVINDVAHLDDGSVLFMIANVSEGQAFITFPDYPMLDNWHEWMH